MVSDCGLQTTSKGVGGRTAADHQSPASGSRINLHGLLLLDALFADWRGEWGEGIRLPCLDDQVVT